MKKQNQQSGNADLTVIATALEQQGKQIQELIDRSRAKEAATRTWLDTPQAARYLQCSTQFLEGLRCHGGGPRFARNGRLVRYHRNDLDDWLKSNRRSNTADVL